jgi:hypothetical protein
MGHNGKAHIDHKDGTEEIEDDVNGDDDANDNLDVKSIRFLFPEFRDDTSPVGIGTTKTRSKRTFHVSRSSVSSSVLG